MIGNLKNGTLARLVNRLGIVWRVKYRHIHIASGVAMDVQGAFSYGGNCIIAKNSVITVPVSGSLELGTGCYIGRYAEVGATGQIEIGENTSIQDRCVILGDVSIGENCLLSYNVYVSSGRHYFDLKPWWLIKDQDAFVAQDEELSSLHSRPVVIEDDCLIGINAVLMAGITIGKGVVIGANSVVTKDIEPYSIAAGVPAKVIKKRLNFSPPKKISCLTPQDFPYFYSGFNTSQAALPIRMVHGGMQAKNRFVILLDTSGANSIHMILNGPQGKAAKLILNETYSINLPEKMSEVVFKIDAPINNKLCFNVHSEIGASSVIIQKAWVE